MFKNIKKAYISYGFNIPKQIIGIYKHKGLISVFFFILEAIENNYLNKLRHSYSQKGEDILIDNLLHKEKGRYVDVGAHNPDKLSNTKRFYMKGWCGINIEPNPELITQFLIKRTRDINLNIGIGQKQKNLFYQINPNGLSTFSEKEAVKYVKLGYKIERTFRVPMFKLDKILKKYNFFDFEFLSVDAEGSDLEVLKTNDWIKFRPKVICVETGDHELLVASKKGHDLKQQITEYLLSKDFKEYLDNGLNTIFVDKDFRPNSRTH